MMGDVRGCQQAAANIFWSRTLIWHRLSLLPAIGGFNVLFIENGWALRAVRARALVRWRWSLIESRVQTKRNCNSGTAGHAPVQ